MKLASFNEEVASMPLFSFRTINTTITLEAASYRTVLRLIPLFAPVLTVYRLSWMVIVKKKLTPQNLVSVASEAPSMVNLKYEKFSIFK